MVVCSLCMERRVDWKQRQLVQHGHDLVDDVEDDVVEDVEPIDKMVLRMLQSLLLEER